MCSLPTRTHATPSCRQVLHILQVIGCSFSALILAIVQHVTEPAQNEMPCGLMPKLLCLAAEGDFESEVSLLLSHCADGMLDYEDAKQRNALWYAARNGNSRLLQDLVRAGSHFNRPDENWWSPLKVACLEGNTRCAELLLQVRADVNGARDQDGKLFISPLIFACDKGHDACVSLLLRYGADTTLEVRELKKRGEPATAGTIAAGRGFHSCAQLVVQHERDELALLRSKVLHRQATLNEKVRLKHVEREGALRKGYTAIIIKRLKAGLDSSFLAYALCTAVRWGARRDCWPAAQGKGVAQRGVPC